MTTFSVQLQIKDLKIVNLAAQRFDYYLKAQYQDQEPEFTGCKDIVKEETVFHLKGGRKLSRLEIWDYHKKKQLVSLVIRKLDSKNGFQSQLQKLNLTIKVTKSVNAKDKTQKKLMSSHVEKKNTLETSSSLQQVITVASC